MSGRAGDHGANVASADGIRAAHGSSDASSGSDRGRAGSHPDAALTWEPILEWLMSTEARSVARRCLRRCALPTGEDVVDDVLGDVTVSVLRQRDRNPTVVDNPAAYAATVIRNHVAGLVRRSHEPLDESNEPVHEDVIDPGFADEVRVIIAATKAPAWLTSASLTYLTLVMYPGAVPDSAPSPRSGSRPDQARAWPSLWLAGLRDLFVDPCPPSVRRRRGRRITHLLDHMADAFARFRLQQWEEDHRGD